MSLLFKDLSSNFMTTSMIEKPQKDWNKVEKNSKKQLKPLEKVIGLRKTPHRPLNKLLKSNSSQLLWLLQTVHSQTALWLPKTMNNQWKGSNLLRNLNNKKFMKESNKISYLSTRRNNKRGERKEKKN